MVKSKSRLVARRRRARSGRRLRARVGAQTGGRPSVGAKVGGRPPHPNPKVVKEAERIFAGMGMTPYEAVVIFYKQTALHGDFPITELIPNEITQAALREPRESLVRYGSVDEMIADLWRDA